MSIGGDRRRATPSPAEVVAVTAGTCCAACRSAPTHGLRAGMPVRAHRPPARASRSGRGLLGRVLDGLGRPIDGKGPLRGDALGARRRHTRRTRWTAPASTPRWTSGVRVLDTLVTVGRGQRIGPVRRLRRRQVEPAVDDRPRHGRRGVRDRPRRRAWPRGARVPRGRPRAPRAWPAASSSSRRPTSRRWCGCARRSSPPGSPSTSATQGAHVVLMMDSLTRVAMAQREIGLSVGEPPATRGYPPSHVRAARPAARARRAPAERGSVTGLYTVLVDGDDHNEPIADAARSILDGHVVLDRAPRRRRALPERRRARLDLPRRVPRHDARAAAAAATGCARCMAARRQAQDLLDVGAYVAGLATRWSTPPWRTADAIDAFLRQGMDEVAPAGRRPGRACAALVARAWGTLMSRPFPLGRAAAPARAWPRSRPPPSSPRARRDQRAPPSTRARATAERLLAAPTMPAGGDLPPGRRPSPSRVALGALLVEARRRRGRAPTRGRRRRTQTLDRRAPDRCARSSGSRSGTTSRCAPRRRAPSSAVLDEVARSPRRRASAGGDGA